MSEHGLKINTKKSELIHHTWRNNDQKATNNQPPAIDTPVTIHHIGRQQATVLRPTRTIKWLGVIFDTKLTFQKHLKATSTQATNAINSLNMLGNSVRGLHQVYCQHLVQGAILPMVLYASPAWWNGTASQAKHIETVQNRGLRYITGAFRTTPISAMQIEALIPPITLTLDYAVKRKANAIQHFSLRHPVTHRLPAQHWSNDIRTTDSLLFEEPHKAIGNHTRPKNRAARELKNAKCTPIYRIGQHILTNTEKIDKTAEAPWHRIDERVKIRVPPTVPGKPQKKEWAEQHKRLLRRIVSKPDEITVYTDGSLRHERGV